jgi:uncharacterized membrane protein YtjA (UPF0391 family)
MGSLANIIWIVVVVLVVLWLLSLVLNLAAGALGWAVHLLLVIAVILIVYNLITGRRAV